jgi:hypothetical protein
MAESMPTMLAPARFVVATSVAFVPLIMFGRWLQAKGEKLERERRRNWRRPFQVAITLDAGRSDITVSVARFAMVVAIAVARVRPLRDAFAGT